MNNSYPSGIFLVEIARPFRRTLLQPSQVTRGDIWSSVMSMPISLNAIKGELLRTCRTSRPSVRVFKDENLFAFAALIRVRRLLDTYESMEDENAGGECVRGWFAKWDLGQFDRHINVSFLSIMERYRHDSPQGHVGEWMTNQGNSIKKASVKSLPETALQTFEKFCDRIWEYDFQEKSILLMILLESFTQDDWIPDCPVMLWLCLSSSCKMGTDVQSFIEGKKRRGSWPVR